MVEIVIFLIGAGALTGFMSGLLGTGGTMFLAPMLLACLHRLPIDPAKNMQIVLGTSLGIMIFSSYASFRSHKKLNNIDFSIVKLGMVTVIPCLLVGSVVADKISSDLLKMGLGVYLVVISFRLFYVAFTSHLVVREPRLLSGQSKMTMGGLLGFFSGFLGIGGSSITVPYMMHYNIEQRIIGGTTTFFTISVSIIGTICYMYNGYVQPDMPHTLWTLGYVMWPAVAIITPFSMYFAKHGAVLSKKLEDRVLKLILASLFITLGIGLIL